jgi:capsular polysaccharide biosynthesis protein
MEEMVMELRKYLGLLGRGWWIILVATAVVYVGLTVFTSRQTKVYSSSTSLVISPSPSWVSNYKEILDALGSLDKRSIIVTYETVLGSATTRQKAIDTLQLPPEKLRNLKVIAQAVTEANAVQITVEASDPDVAAETANTIAQQGISDLKNLYQVYELTQLDPATPARTPIRPNVAQANLGAPLGALLGAAIVLFLNYLSIPVPSLIPDFRRRPRATSVAAGRAALVRLVRQELQRMPARQRELGLIMIGLPSTTPEGSEDGSASVRAEQLRAYLQRELRHRDTLVGLPETNSLAVVMPGADKHDAERVADQVRTRLVQDEATGLLDATWSLAAFERGDGRSDLVITRAEAGMDGADTTPDVLPASEPNATITGQVATAQAGDRSETSRYTDINRVDEVPTALY